MYDRRIRRGLRESGEFFVTSLWQSNSLGGQQKAAATPGVTRSGPRIPMPRSSLSSDVRSATGFSSEEFP